MELEGPTPVDKAQDDVMVIVDDVKSRGVGCPLELHGGVVRSTQTRSAFSFINHSEQWNRVSKRLRQTPCFMFLVLSQKEG